MGKLVLIVGKSCSGKDSILRILKAWCGVDTIVSCTTRHPRNYEINGVDYNFLTDEEFCNLIEDGYFIEWKEYVGWKYGTPWSQVKGDGNKFSIVEPKGLAQFIEILGRENIIVVYVEAEPLTRVYRLDARGDDPMEGIRRIESDDSRDDFKELLTTADFVFYNNNDFDPIELINQVNFFYEEVLVPCLDSSKDYLGIREIVKSDIFVKEVIKHIGIHQKK